VSGLVALFCAAAPLRLCAQSLDTIPKPRIPAYVRYGKWVALGAAAGLGATAYSRNQDAETTYETLRQRCFATPLACMLASNGTYTDPQNEALYDKTRTLDHQAARYLIGAELTFAGAAVGFVWELTHRHDKPHTIPFEPRVEQTSTATHLGLSVRF
jgi:hypothetical protein